MKSFITVRSLLIAAIVAGDAGAAVRKVPGQFATIAAAVDAAQPGDVIQIEPNPAPGSGGAYRENIVVQPTKPGLQFIGKGRPTWDGSGGAQLSCFGPGNDNVVVKGIRFRCGSHPLYIFGDRATVDGCSFESITSGAAIEIGGARAVVRDCRVRDSYDQGVLITGDQPTVKDCEFLSIDYPGIQVEAATGGVIQGNRLERCSDGIFLVNVTGTRVVDNDIINDSVDGITFYGNDVIVRNNRLRGVGGSLDDNEHCGINAGEESHRAVIEKNVIERSHGVAIELDGTSARIVGNQIDDTDAGIRVQSLGPGPRIEKNVIKNCDGQLSGAIQVLADDFTISGNRIDTVRGYSDGIRVVQNGAEATGGTITDNVISGCSRSGIVVGVNHTRVEGNTVSDSGQAFHDASGYQVFAGSCELVDNVARQISGAGFLVWSGGLDEVRANQNHLLACSALDCAGNGIEIEAGAGNVVENCRVFKCNFQGLSVASGTTGTVVTGNLLKKSRLDFAGNGRLANATGNVFGSGGPDVAPEIDFP